MPSEMNAATDRFCVWLHPLILLSVRRVNVNVVVPLILQSGLQE